MYEDFIAAVIYASMHDLIERRLNSLQELQDRFKIADDAVHILRNWWSQSANYVTTATVLEDPSCLSAPGTKQVCKHKSSSALPPVEQQSLVDLLRSILTALNWPLEDILEACEHTRDLLRMSGHKSRFYSAMMGHQFDRAIFVTENGSIGRGPPAIRPRDIVVILFGGRTPFILRPTDVDGEYQFIGDCYVDGIMHGEYIEGLKADGKFEECRTTFTLV
jgi:hypothetical protein